MSLLRQTKKCQLFYHWESLKYFLIYKISTLLVIIHKHSSNANLPAAGKLSSKVFLTKSSEMINRKYERDKAEPWRKQHIGAPAIA